jgi:hypothetical protein
MLLSFTLSYINTHTHTHTNTHTHTQDYISNLAGVNLYDTRTFSPYTFEEDIYVWANDPKVCVCVVVCVCVFICEREGRRGDIYTCIHKRTHTYKHPHTDKENAECPNERDLEKWGRGKTHTHTHIHTSTYTPTYTHTHTHTHTHTQQYEAAAGTALNDDLMRSYAKKMILLLDTYKLPVLLCKCIHTHTNTHPQTHTFADI